MNGQTHWLPFSDYALHAAVCVVVACAWVGFEVVLFIFLRRRATRAGESQRDTRSRAGLALQGLSYVVVLAFILRRRSRA